MADIVVGSYQTPTKDPYAPETVNGIYYKNGLLGFQDWLGNVATGGITDKEKQSLTKGLSQGKITQAQYNSLLGATPAPAPAPVVTTTAPAASLQDSLWEANQSGQLSEADYANQMTNLRDTGMLQLNLGPTVYGTPANDYKIIQSLQDNAGVNDFTSGVTNIVGGLVKPKNSYYSYAESVLTNPYLNDGVTPNPLFNPSAVPDYQGSMDSAVQQILQLSKATGMPLITEQDGKTRVFDTGDNALNKELYGEDVAKLMINQSGEGGYMKLGASGSLFGDVTKALTEASLKAALGAAVGAGADALGNFAAGGNLALTGEQAASINSGLFSDTAFNLASTGNYSDNSADNVSSQMLQELISSFGPTYKPDGSPVTNQNEPVVADDTTGLYGYHIPPEILDLLKNNGGGGSSSPKDTSGGSSSPSNVEGGGNPVENVFDPNNQTDPNSNKSNPEFYKIESDGSRWIIGPNGEWRPMNNDEIMVGSPSEPGIYDDVGRPVGKVSGPTNDPSTGDRTDLLQEILSGIDWGNLNPNGELLGNDPFGDTTNDIVVGSNATDSTQGTTGDPTGGSTEGSTGTSGTTQGGTTGSGEDIVVGSVGTGGTGGTDTTNTGGTGGGDGTGSGSGSGDGLGSLGGLGTLAMAMGGSAVDFKNFMAGINYQVPEVQRQQLQIVDYLTLYLQALAQNRKTA